MAVEAVEGKDLVEEEEVSTRPKEVDEEIEVANRPKEVEEEEVSTRSNVALSRCK